MKILSAISGITNGVLKMSDRKKYSILTFSVALVHLTLIFVFIRIGSVPMAVYNAFSVAGYLLCIPLIKRGALGWVFTYICIEVPLHSFLAIYAAGWDFGFAMYLIAIVPVGFEMSFALKDTVKGIKGSALSSTLSLVMYISCRMYSYFNEPYYTVDDDLFVQTVYLCNVICTFALLCIYSFIFVSEINAAQSALKQKNSELANLAARDPLTGFYNRRKMHDFLYSAAESGETFSLIMSDIDNFKRFNDDYGHDCGDLALKAVSEVCSSCLSNECRICRWGGEEFLILIYCPADEAAAVAESIRAAVESRRLNFNGCDIRVTLTLGVSQYDPTSTVDKAITAADKKLYEGKSSGKNRVVK